MFLTSSLNESSKIHQASNLNNFLFDHFLAFFVLIKRGQWLEKECIRWRIFTSENIFIHSSFVTSLSNRSRIFVLGRFPLSYVNQFPKTPHPLNGNLPEHYGIFPFSFHLKAILHFIHNHTWFRWSPHKKTKKSPHQCINFSAQPRNDLYLVHKEIRRN